MNRAGLCTLIGAFAIVTAACAAQAQTKPPVPPIKPGLWQVHIEREVNGQKAPDMSERMKNMPPKRAQIEAMMKQHGVAWATPGIRSAIPRVARSFALGGGRADGLEAPLSEPSHLVQLEVAHVLSKIRI